MCRIHKVKPLIHATGTNDTVSNQPFKSAVQISRALSWGRNRYRSVLG